MKKIISEHIDRVREAQDHKKRIWIGSASAVVMIIIFSLWLWYISETLPRAGITNTTSTIPAVQKVNKKHTIFSSIISGFKITTANITSSFSQIGNSVGSGIGNAIETVKKEQAPKKEQPEKSLPFAPNEIDEPEIVPLQ